MIDPSRSNTRAVDCVDEPPIDNERRYMPREK
jgi:hypothetical protein